jgi:hypothetical protein
VSWGEAAEVRARRPAKAAVIVKECIMIDG